MTPPLESTPGAPASSTAITLGSPAASRAAAALAIATLVGLSIHFTIEYRGNVVDDALISFRYAQNLVEGNGLVFNPGERVEGYTNFLWTLVLAGLYAIAGNPDAMVPLAVGASIGAAAIALLLVYLLGRRIWGDALVPTVATLGLVALDNAYGVWAIQALEGHFLLVWMLLSLYLADARPRGWPVLLGLVLVAVQTTRWDGFLVALALGSSWGIELLRAVRRGDDGVRSELRSWGLVVAVGAIVYGAWFAWRWSYYGHPLPNTFYLKVGESNAAVWLRGLRYVSGYFVERAWIPALALFALPLVGRPLVRALLLFVVFHLVYLLRVGGDFYPGHRFLLVVTPFLALLIGAAVAAALERAGRSEKHASAVKAALAVGVAAMVAVVAWRGIRHGPYQTEIRRWRDHIARVRGFNTWLREYKKPGDFYALGDIGAAGFYAGIPVIDVYGVVDPEVAHLPVELGRGKAGHEKIADGRRVIARRPRFIADGYVRGVDLERAGYFRSGAVPAHLSADWLWERDDLATTGTFLEETRISFDRWDPAWHAEGEAFARWPTRRPVEGQQPVRGQLRGYIDTFVPGKGDLVTGTLRSPPFPLVGDKLVLRVGGGNDPERLRVSLLVDGERRFSESGHDTEVLTRRVWDIASLRGREAVLEIVDEATGGWGHILVDEVVQWRAHDVVAPTTADVAEPDSPR